MAFTKSDFFTMTPEQLDAAIREAAKTTVEGRGATPAQTQEFMSNPESWRRLGSRVLLQNTDFSAEDAQKMAAENPSAIASFDGTSYGQAVVYGFGNGDQRIAHANDYFSKYGKVMPPGMDTTFNNEDYTRYLESAGIRFTNTGTADDPTGGFSNLTEGLADAANPENIAPAAAEQSVGSVLGPAAGEIAGNVSEFAIDNSLPEAAALAALVGGGAELVAPGSVSGLFGGEAAASGAASGSTAGAAAGGAAAAGLPGATDPLTQNPVGDNALNTNSLSGLVDGMDTFDWLNLASSGLTSYLSNEAAEDMIDENRRQFDLTRQDYAPYREVGPQALSEYVQGINEYNTNLPDLNVSPDAALPQYQSTGQQIGYNNDAPLPEYQSTGQQLQYQNNTGLPEYDPYQDFEFNLEEDQGYNFAKSEAMKAVERAMASRGMNQSGNLLSELQNRATGLASQYTNDAFNRQLGTYNTNYGKNVTDYGIQQGINDRSYERGVRDYGINAARNTENYNRNLSDFNTRKGLSDTRYNRGVTDYGINAARNTENYQRNINDYGIGTDRANMVYGRDMDRYNVDRTREGDLYNRNQTRLSQLGGLVDVGRGATGALASAGYNTTQANNAITGTNVANINDSVQDGLSNWMTNRYLRRYS